MTRRESRGDGGPGSSLSAAVEPFAHPSERLVGVLGDHDARDGRQVQVPQQVALSEGYDHAPLGPIHARITFEPTGLGTRVQFHAHGELAGAMRLAQPLLRVTLRRQFDGYCATLKRVMENSPASA